MYTPGFIYDKLLEPMLRRIKRRVAGIVSKYGLDSCLDVCCGTGVQCSFIESRGTRVVGLDLDRKMLEFAAMKYPLIPFVCADAAKAPFKPDAFRGLVISFALHDKKEEMRTQIIRESANLIGESGYVVFVDFVKPWNFKSKIGYLFSYLIERMAGGEHFRNGRQFLSAGGLDRFMLKSGIVVVERHDIALGCLSVVLAKFG